LEKVKQKLRERYKEFEERIDRLKVSDLINELDKLHVDGLKLVLPEEMTGALKGKYSVLQQEDSMFRNASSSINILTTPAGLNDLFENHLGLLKKVNEKGVKIRIASKIDKGTSDAIKALAGIAEVRNIGGNELPLSGRFYVVDGQQMMIGLSDPEIIHSSQDMMFWTKSEHAAKNVIDPLFNLVWQKAKPIKISQ
jgi:sugar-specific transcriptional regulator TrmB